MDSTGQVLGYLESRALRNHLGLRCHEQFTGRAAQETGDISEGVEQQFLPALFNVGERRAGEPHGSSDFLLGSTGSFSCRSQD